MARSPRLPASRVRSSSTTQSHALTGKTRAERIVEQINGLSPRCAGERERSRKLFRKLGRDFDGYANPFTTPFIWARTLSVPRSSLGRAVATGLTELGVEREANLARCRVTNSVTPSAPTPSADTDAPAVEGVENVYPEYVAQVVTYASLVEAAGVATS